jgi:hypothetical protein
MVAFHTIMASVRLVFISGALMLCAATAPAQTRTAEAKIGRVGPGTATSPCIGTATSPVCMAETLLACFARADAALCSPAGADARAGAREPGLIEYLIERVTVIRPEDITEELRDLDWFKPGYTLVEIRRRHCPGDAGCGSEAWDDLQIYLRPRGDLWEVVSWRSEAEPEGAPEIPDAFRPQGPRQ